MAREENAARRYFLMKEFAEYQVGTVVNATITQIVDGSVEVEQGGAELSLPCDTVVVALGMAPDLTQLEGIRQVAEVIVVGDAVEASDGLKASREGFVCGLTL